MTDPPEAPSRLAAALADQYRLERELGQGGMATVYLAHDLKHDRQVAIKVLREDLSASLGSGRFLREIKIAAQLQHPHILPLLDSGEADGFLYFVMPYVKGQSLRERLAREGELPVHEAVRLITEVVDALVEAHAHGVVHRDIKPDNVMLSGRHALVTDFGVAKAISEATGRNTITTMGVAVGTPTYMSPEQAAADPNVDHRSDIYSVGVMAYEMLCGRPPFTGGTPQQVLAAHVTEAPDALIKRRPTIAAAVDAVIMKCLAKRAADRYQAAADLLAALEPLATPSTGITPTDTRPVAAVHGMPPRRIGSWLAVGALVVLGGTGWAFLRHRSGVVPGEHSLQRIQLTTSGNASSPVVAPDGKQVAYTSCEMVRDQCVYSLIVQDVATGAHQTIVDHAGQVLPLQWSASGAWILAQVIPDSGTSLPSIVTISHLGGAMTPVGTIAHLTPRGDTVLTVAEFMLRQGQPVFLRRMAAPWQQVIDSVRIDVPDSAMFLNNISVSPDDRWIAAVWEFPGQTNELLTVLDRAGHQKASRLVPENFSLGEWSASGSSFLRPINVQGQSSLERIAVDGRSGTLGRTDTIALSTSAAGPAISRSLDGRVFAYVEQRVGDGVVSTLEAPAPFQPPRLGTPLQHGAALRQVRIAPDGETVFFASSTNAGADLALQWFAIPYKGGAARAVTPPLRGILGSVVTMDSRQLVVASKLANGRSTITSYDVASGRAAITVERPDTLYTLYAAGPNHVAIVTTDGHRIVLLGDSLRERRRLVLPDSMGRVATAAATVRDGEILVGVQPLNFAATFQSDYTWHVPIYTYTDAGWRTMGTVNGWNFSGPWSTADGSLLYEATTGTNPRGVLWRIPPGGTMSQRIGPVPYDHWSTLADLATDGRRGVVLLNRPVSDIWLINDLPAVMR